MNYLCHIAEYFGLSVKLVLASEKGQLLYKGQNAHSQFVRYSEVLLYIILIVSMGDVSCSGSVEITQAL